MTGGEVGIVLALLGVIGTAWWRIYSMVTDAAEKGEKAQADLAAHKLHVAETYTTKAGMAEQTAQIMRALEGLGNRIDGVHERLDSWMRAQSSK